MQALQQSGIGKTVNKLAKGTMLPSAVVEEAASVMAAWKRRTLQSINSSGAAAAASAPGAASPPGSETPTPTSSPADPLAALCASKAPLDVASIAGGARSAGPAHLNGASGTPAAAPSRKRPLSDTEPASTGEMAVGRPPTAAVTRPPAAGAAPRDLGLRITPPEGGAKRSGCDRNGPVDQLQDPGSAAPAASSPIQPVSAAVANQPPASAQHPAKRRRRRRVSWAPAFSLAVIREYEKDIVPMAAVQALNAASDADGSEGMPTSFGRLQTDLSPSGLDSADVGMAVARRGGHGRGPPAVSRGIPWQEPPRIASAHDDSQPLEVKRGAESTEAAAQAARIRVDFDVDRYLWPDPWSSAAPEEPVVDPRAASSAPPPTAIPLDMAAAVSEPASKAIPMDLDVAEPAPSAPGGVTDDMIADVLKLLPSTVKVDNVDWEKLVTEMQKITEQNIPLTGEIMAALVDCCPANGGSAGPAAPPPMTTLYGVHGSDAHLLAAQMLQARGAGDYTPFNDMTGLFGAHASSGVRSAAEASAAELAKQMLDKSQGNPERALAELQLIPGVGMLPPANFGAGAYSQSGFNVAHAMSGGMMYGMHSGGGTRPDARQPALPAGTRTVPSYAYRTKPCRYHKMPGGCRNGAKCTFLHD